MSVNSKPSARPWLLGIEGGGTHTVALLADARGRLIRRFEAGPGNLRLLADPQLVRLLRSIAAAFPKPDAVAVGLAGARAARDLERIRRAAAKVWPQIPCQPTNDLETALAAATQTGGEVQGARVLILSGTGSCCYGRSAAGKAAKLGGWGHVLGDKGSGYEIGLRGLKATVFRYDRDGVWPRLGQRLLRRLQLNEPGDLIPWAQTADKAAIASLAVDVFESWNVGDKIAADILAGAAGSLANDGLACAGKLVRPGLPVQFIFAGSTLLKQPRFARRVAAQLRKQWPGAKITRLEREGAWGAVALARQLVQLGATPLQRPERRLQAAASFKLEMELRTPAVVSTHLSPTEQRHPRSMHLDRMSLPQSVKLMLSEDARITKALLPDHRKIEMAVRLISRAFNQDGRLFYVGAGTSGRLGVLDASECPPTFRTHPDQVQGIIAGGREALWRSVEGAEDDADAGARAVQFRGIGRRDVVVGIAASGRTPFVWGALGEARQRGAKTVLLAFNPFLKIPRSLRPSLTITPNLGPELLTGSTRLKAGTATKLVLNIFTTLAMVRQGKVVSNLMVDLNPLNVKLRDRAVRIVQELRGVNYAAAAAALEKSGWVIKSACARLKRNAKVSTT